MNEVLQLVRNVCRARKHPMTELNSVEYYRTREQQERGLAVAATSPAIAKIHIEMADRYADLAEAVVPELQPRPMLRAHSS